MIFIPENVPSLKNSKVATKKGVFMSKSCRRYLQKIGVKRYGRDGVEEYKTRQNIFRIGASEYFQDIKYPAEIGFHFVRDSRRKFDFSNAVQIVADLLAAHGFIQDDNMDFFIPLPFQIDGKWYTVNKQNPGVFIKIF